MTVAVRYVLGLGMSVGVALAALSSGCTPTGIGKSVAVSEPTDAFPTPWPPEEAAPARRAKATPAVATAEADEATSPGGDGGGRGERGGADEAGGGALVVAAPQPRTFALVVGVETYRDVGVPAAGAARDVERLTALLTTTFGVPPQQQRIASGKRATKSDVLGHIDWLARNVSEGGRVLFFFSGHGSARASDGAPLLLPYDSDPTNLERSGLPLADVLDGLGRTPAGEVLAFVDACYSGSGGRSVVPKGARPLMRIKTAPVAGATAVLSASGAEQLSGANASGRMGLFTQHLVRAIGEGLADIDGDGQIKLSELVTWVTPRVQREAHELGREQTPTLATSLPASHVVVGHGYPPR